MTDVEDYFIKERSNVRLTNVPETKKFKTKKNNIRHDERKLS